MKPANDYMALNTCLGSPPLNSKEDAAGRRAEAFSIKDFINALIKHIECFKPSVPILFAEWNLDVGLKRGERFFFPLFTQMQEMVKRVNHAMKASYNFVATQLMCRDRFQGTFALAEGRPNHSPNSVKLSAIATRGCASKGLRTLMQAFVCTYNKRGNCCGAPCHDSNIGFSKKSGGVSILPTHHEYCHPQRSYRADGLNPAWPAIFRQASIVANEAGNDRSRHQCDTKKYIGFLHESIQSYLKGILA